MSESSWVTVQTGSPSLALPLLCDSPHSGTDYPEDFGHAIDRQSLRSGEDTFVERLWDHAPQTGATLISARFPRTYIDPNRPLESLDPQMLDGPWPQACEPSRQTRLGIGLIWRQVAQDAPIYARKLSVAEVQRRIDHFWRPYHATLATAARQTYDRFGCCWHLNLHSMPHNAYERLGIQSNHPLADVVLGDLHGVTCDPEFVDVVRRAIEAHGYRVALNDPYAGVDLIRQMGAPAERRHSLQVELNRSLYMDERTREPNADFEHLRRDLASVLEEIARYIRSHPHLRAAQAA